MSIPLTDPRKLLETHSAGSEAHGYSRLVGGPARAPLLSKSSSVADVSIRVLMVALDL